MTESLQTSADAVARELVFLDESAAPGEWRELAASFGAVRGAARAEGLAGAEDAADVAAELAAAAAEGYIADPAALMENLQALSQALCAMAEEYARGAAPKRSAKAEVGAARVFLHDLEAGASSEDAEAGQTGDAEADEFRQEMLARVDAVEQLLLDLPEGRPAPEAIAGIFREYHTLKGETGILGLKELNAFFHRVESAVEPARNEPVIVTAELTDALVQASDLSRALLGGRTAPGSEACDACIGRIESAVASAPVGASPGSEPFQTGEDVAGAEAADADDEFFAAMGTAGAGEPLSQPALDPSAAADAGGVDALLAESLEAVEEEPVAESETMQVVPVDVGRIDALLDLVATTAATTSQVVQHPALEGVADGELAADLTALRRSVGSLQDLAVGLRMTPVRPLFQRLRRAAYDVSRSSRKNIEVVVEGASAEVDRSVIEQLTGGLVHVVRNAIDHGIEPSAERRAAGKPERGRLELSARRQGSDVVLQVSDDGQGLNTERIREQAIAAGLLPPGDRSDPHEVHKLIFHSGLSTAGRVTGTSGRGVGMEAVQTAAEALRGRVDVLSDPGEGTLVKLVLPLALAAIDGLVVRVGDARYVLPVTSVRQSFQPADGDLSTVEGRGRMVRFRNALLPVIDLARELGQETNGAANVFVAVEHQNRLAALAVDAVVSTRQVLVRPLEGNLAKVPVVSGSASLDGRRLALVLEPAALLATVSTSSGGELGEVQKREGQIETVDIGGNQVGMVDFTLRFSEGGRTRAARYAINAFKAREFIPDTELTAIPNAPPGFAGMLLLRNQTLPVVDLRTLLGFAASEEEAGRTLIVCEFGAMTIGIRVSAVNRVHYISWGDIKPPPETGTAAAHSAVVGTILMEEEVVFVLDFEQIVQMVLRLYKDYGASFHGVEQRKTGSRILLVEDSRLVRTRAAEALRAAGLEVLEAANGEEARKILIDLIEEVEGAGGSIFDRLDLVLSDIEMPQMDGYTLTSTIKGHPSLVALPVVLHSSLSNETIVRRAKEVQADGVVGKHDPQILADQLRKYL
jgi:two-component system chemotaxis sensor kinase CheA